VSLFPDWPEIDYEQAVAAHEAGQKLHLGGRVFLVRPTPARAGSTAGQRPVLWVTDEQTTGERGLILFPDGRIEAR